MSSGKIAFEINHMKFLIRFDHKVCGTVEKNGMHKGLWIVVSMVSGSTVLAISRSCDNSEFSSQISSTEIFFCTW